MPESEPGERGYSWEEKHKSSWDVFAEDDSDSLQRLYSSIQRQTRRTNLEMESASVHRGIVRHLVVILDLSESLERLELRPNKSNFIFSLVERFITEFFDQNPLSNVGLVAMRDSMAFPIARISCSLLGCINALKKSVNREVKGYASLQNAFELSNILLNNVSLDGQKEILVIYCSLSTHDPGNIFDTIESLKKSQITVTIIGFAAEIYVCKKICEETNGTYSVALNEEHLEHLLFDCIPPRSLSKIQSGKLIEMGFPTAVSYPTPSLCMCHLTPVRRGYKCPVCGCFVCNISMSCPVCKITLISSPLLARSYYHLFPVPLFTSIEKFGENDEFKCFACFQKIFPVKPPEFSMSNNTKEKTLTDDLVYKCNLCGNTFCSTCDLFIHKKLHNCPGCLYGS